MEQVSVLNIIIIIIAAYFLGSLSFGWMIARLRGVNILEKGSGNPASPMSGACSASNGLARAHFRRCQGVFFRHDRLPLGGELGMMIGFVVAIVGHSKSWMLHFKGGKGIATAGGALLYVSPITLAILLVILGIIVGITKYMSLGSLTVVIIAPFLLYFEGQPPVVIGVIVCGLIYVIWLHRGNIKRLLNGTENKIGQKRS